MMKNVILNKTVDTVMKIAKINSETTSLVCLYQPKTPDCLKKKQK